MFDKGEQVQAKRLPAKFENYVAENAKLVVSNHSNRQGKKMKSHLTAVLIGAAHVGMSIAAIAHHSFAMFDQANPIDLAGVVKDWKYTAPHVFIVLEVKGAGGTTQVWNLEGNTPSARAHDGWTAKTL